MMGAWSRSSDNLNKLPGRESFADHADQARRGGLNGKQQNGGASASASRANSILTSACRLRGNAAYRNFPQSSLVSLMSAMKNALPTGLSLKRFGPVGSVLRHKISCSPSFASFHPIIMPSVGKSFHAFAEETPRASRTSLFAASIASGAAKPVADLP